MGQILHGAPRTSLNVRVGGKRRPAVILLHGFFNFHGPDMERLVAGRERI